MDSDESSDVASVPLMWSADVLSENRRDVHTVFNYVLLAGPGLIWTSGWNDIFSTIMNTEDTWYWSYTVKSTDSYGFLLKT